MKLKILQLNCLDLFIFIDNPLIKQLKDYSEDEWQRLTYSPKGNKKLKHIFSLANLIKKINPDVLLLNEVGGKESLSNFNKLFLNDKYQIAMKEKSTRGIDTGFLIKKQFKFKHKGYSKTKIEDKDYKFSRAINKLTILDKQEKPILNIFGVHLKSLRGDSTNPEIIETRYNEVKGLVHLMKDARKKDKAPYIVGGDFNGNAKLKDYDFEFKYLYRHTSLRDIHDLNKSSDLDRYSFVRLLRNNQIEYNQIDYIMLSKDLHKKINKVKRYLYRVDNKDTHISTYTEKNMLPSDHYPQFVSIKL